MILCQDQEEDIRAEEEDPAWGRDVDREAEASEVPVEDREAALWEVRRHRRTTAGADARLIRAEDVWDVCAHS